MIEVAGPEERQEIDTPDDVSIDWLYRREGRSGLARRIEDIEWPDCPDVFAWSGSEFTEFGRMRTDWRKRRNLPKYQHLAVAYWRAGHAQH